MHITMKAILEEMMTRCVSSLASQTGMRLRLGSSGVELGYHFAIHPSTVSRIFSDVIEMLSVRLKFLIMWPDRYMLRKTLPMDFRKHCPNCLVIIDCFEVFIDRPSDALAQGQTYSKYMNTTTLVLPSF